MNARQMRFVDEYMRDLNATQAAIRAGYSERTAKSIGQRLLTFVDVSEEIKLRLDAVRSSLIAEPQEILQTLTRVLRREETEHVVVTVKKHNSYYDDNGKKVIEDVETPEVVEIKPKLSDVNKAAELLARVNQMFNDKLKLEGALPVVITGADMLED